MALLDDISSLVADIDNQIAFIKADAQARIAVLATKRATLVQAASLVNPQIEQAFNALKSLGVIK